MCCKGAENTHNENESLASVSLNLIFLINLFTSVFMTGLIWLVQLVYYPAFQFADQGNFKAFHRFHNRRISLIVVPVMIIELVTSGVLWWNYGPLSAHGVGFYLVILIWISTAAFSVPNHAKLASGKDEKVIRSLVHTNWFRTILWSVKSLLTLWLLSP